MMLQTGSACHGMAVNAAVQHSIQLHVKHHKRRMDHSLVSTKQYYYSSAPRAWQSSLNDGRVHHGIVVCTTV
jgi:hypothetical protein